MNRALKKLGSVFLALAMVITLLPAAALAAETIFSYIAEDGTEETVQIDSANVIDISWTDDSGSGNALSDGWYVVTENVSVYSLAISGNVKLILSDGAAFTVNNGIYLKSGNSLTIYGQRGGTGSMTVSDTIGYDYGGGSLAIYGGAVTALGGIIVDAGIFHNGTVTATGSTAISGKSITITGGTVTAHSTKDAGENFSCISANETLSISGGVVKATGGDYGLYSYAKSIIIDGGSIDATTSVQPKNRSNAPVYKSTLLFPEAGPGASVSGAISSAGDYSFNDVKTDGQGRAYLWLPKGEATVDLTIGSKTYDGTFTVKTDNSTIWPLVKRTVTFDTKGGTMASTTAETAEDTRKLATLPEPTLAGHTFDGWYSAYYGGEKITTETVFNLDTTVYARWKVDGRDGITSDTRNIDVSKLTVDHNETGVWSYSATDKTLTVSAAEGTLTLTGTNNNLQVRVTGGEVTLVLRGANINAGARFAVDFTNSAAESTLEVAAGTENTLGSGLNSSRKLTLSGTGTLTLNRPDSPDVDAPFTFKSSTLVINGPTVTSTGDTFGLDMGTYSIPNGTLEVQSGSLTLNKTSNHYTYTLNSDYRSSLTVNVYAGAALTILSGDTEVDTTINNNGGTVYIDGNVVGTAINDDSAGGTFTVTGTVANSAGTITIPVLAEITIDLTNLAPEGTEYYELIDGSTLSHPYLPFDGYRVIQIKQPARFTLTGDAPAGYVLYDTQRKSQYILNNMSIDGLAYYTVAVTVTGTNTVGSFGIPIAGVSGCTYSGSGTLTVQNRDGKNPDGAFPLNEHGLPVIDGCEVEIKGFDLASDGVQVKSGALEADGLVFALDMRGGRADIWYVGDNKTTVKYTGGELALFGRLDTGSTVPGISVIFSSNGGSDMPGLYLYGITSYEMTQPGSPVKADFVFDGWFSDEALTQPVTFPLSVTASAEYFAKWRTSSISITRQPQDIEVVHGETGEISVEAAGAALSFQWYLNDRKSNSGGTLLEGATSPVYTVPATLDSDTVYYYYCAITSGADVVHSAVAQVTVSPPLVQVATPTASPNGGTFATSQSVTLATETEGADIYFTIDGTTPTESSTLYTAPISLTGTTTIKAIAVLSGMADSGMLTVTFTKSSGGGGGGGGAGGPATPPSSAAPTVSGSTATTTVTPTVTNGAAEATVTASQISDTLKLAQDAAVKTGGAPKVEIALETTSGETSAAITIPGTAVQSLASGGAGLTLSTGLGSVTFDLATLSALSGAGDVTVTVAQADTSALPQGLKQTLSGRPVYEFTVTGGGKTISRFGGTVNVAVPYSLKPGEDPNAIIVSFINAAGNLETITNGRYDRATGTVVFTTTHFSLYAVGYREVSFTDMADGAWYFDAVIFLAARGITEGTTATTFSPDGTMTRGQLITMLMRACEIAPDNNPSDNFADAGNTYYTGYLAAAKRLGISNGVGDNLFAPEQGITRQESFTMLYNALKALGKLPQTDNGKTLRDFEDSGRVAPWAREAMTALVKAGIVSGSDGKLYPDTRSTRAQLAQVLYNLATK